MTTIYKYPLKLDSSQIIETHQHSKCLLVDIKNDDICIWFEVNTNMPKVKYEVRIFGTGHDLHSFSKNEHLGSIQKGISVWHIYMRVINS